MGKLGGVLFGRKERNGFSCSAKMVEVSEFSVLHPNKIAAFTNWGTAALAKHVWVVQGLCSDPTCASLRPGTAWARTDLCSKKTNLLTFS